MKPTIFAAALLAAIALAPAAAAQQRTFDPRGYQSRVVGEPTQILVLATPHLSGTPDTWDPAVLEPLLDRLAAFRPDAILIEALPGESVESLWRYREIYPSVATNYAGRTLALATLAGSALQMDRPQAEAELRRILAAWPEAPTAAQRRRLALLFIAAGDPNSALVQWWRLEEGQRTAEDGFTPFLVEQLNVFAARRNENHLIGARLAVRLGLERLYPTDDHASDDVLFARQADMEAFFSQPWFEELINRPDFQPLRNAGQTLNTPQQLMDTYRYVNTLRAGQLDADVQWLSMISRESPNMVGRTRVAEWETRNLRQVANIREIAAQHPGQRILVIVGSAHKPWFEAYLGMMTDVRLVDATRVLR